MKTKAIDWNNPPDVLQFNYSRVKGGSVVLNSNHLVELIIQRYTLQVIYLPFIYYRKEVRLK